VGVRADSPRSRQDTALLDGPHFLRAAPDAPPLAQTLVSFYAVKGQDRKVEIMYHARPGASDSTRFVLFRVPAQSLARSPDGTLLAPGDSILVTLTVVSPLNLIVDFEPSGLQFASGYPAKLVMSYAETDPDINADGVVNGADKRLEDRLKIWYQELREPYKVLKSQLDESHKTVSASVPGFTNYAIAY
jgi:hypothetical protein